MPGDCTADTGAASCSVTDALKHGPHRPVTMGDAVSVPVLRSNALPVIHDLESGEEPWKLPRLQVGSEPRTVIGIRIPADQPPIAREAAVRRILCSESGREDDAAVPRPVLHAGDESLDLVPRECLHQAKDKNCRVGICFRNEIFADGAVGAIRNVLFGRDLLDGVDGHLRRIEGIHRKTLSGQKERVTPLSGSDIEHWPVLAYQVIVLPQN